MRLLTFARFIRMITKKGPADLEKIQKMGLLAVKLTQIFALRPDLLSEEKCKQLQSLYQRANSIPREDSMKLIHDRAPEGFLDAFSSFEEEPFAAASIGQVHKGVLKDGTNVVVKIIKADFEKSFRKDVTRMKRWLRIGLFLNPRLRKVGNPVGLLQHVEDYTLKELDLRNEIEGAELLQQKAKEVEDKFPMPLLSFPRVWPELSNEHILVMEHIESPTLEDRLAQGTMSWDNLLQLFRIHGAFMFGIGTFHGDLHPGNAMVDDEGKFTFIDTGAISHAPDKVRSALFGFFFHLAKGQLNQSFEAMLLMADTPPSGAAKEKYMTSMHEIYTGFIGKTVSEVSLTQQMMKTVRCAVLAGCRFGEEAFPIIRSLMYMDGMVLRGQPNVDLITSMGPYLDEFASIVELPYSEESKTSQETSNSVFWDGNLKPTD